MSEIVHKILYSLGRYPKIIQYLLLFFIEIYFGFTVKCYTAFGIWWYIMTHDIDVLNKKYCGLTGFDEFYTTLNGAWRGAK